jgi:hypothetical protein
VDNRSQIADSDGGVWVRRRHRQQIIPLGQRVLPKPADCASTPVGTTVIPNNSAMRLKRTFIITLDPHPWGAARVPVARPK